MDNNKPDNNPDINIGDQTNVLSFVLAMIASGVALVIARVKFER